MSNEDHIDFEDIYEVDEEFFVDDREYIPMDSMEYIDDNALIDDLIKKLIEKTPIKDRDKIYVQERIQKGNKERHQEKNKEG